MKPHKKNPYDMKNLKIFLVLLFLSVSLACDKDNDDISNSTAEVQELNLIVREGEWRITEYSLNGDDDTANFSDYIFNFEENNEFFADNFNENIRGSWRIYNDSGNEFDSLTDVDFNIFFEATAKLSELTNNYDVISATSDEIKLTIDNQEENGNIILLTFSKN